MQKSAVSLRTPYAGVSIRTDQEQPAQAIAGRKKRYRIALKLLAAFVLVLVLMLFATSEVDFVYTGF